MWYDRFRDLLMNRHPYWEYLLDAVEKQGKTKIHDHKEFMANMDVGDEEARQSITRQEAQYCQQLKSYIRTYSTGELYARTTQTKSTEVLELMREIVHKGRNRNPNRLIDLKAKALSPQRATKAADLDRILTEWRHVRQQIVEEEQSYKMSDDTKQTILLRIMPQEYVKDMRELLTSGKYNDDYYGFEQALYDEINTRKMDEESRKGGGRIGVITEKEGGEEHREHHQRHDEYEQVEVWNEDWQCYICGLMPKGGKRERSRSRGKEEGEERVSKEARTEEHESPGKGSKGKGKGKGAKGKGRPGGPCWTCGGPHFQRECPHGAQSGPSYPITTAWSSWRPGPFPGPTASQWKSWLPKPKGGKKGAGKSWMSQGKGPSGKGKGKGQPIGEMQYQWGPPLGQVQNSWSGEAEYEYDALMPLCAVGRPSVDDWQIAAGKKAARQGAALKFSSESFQRRLSGQGAPERQSMFALIAPAEDEDAGPDWEHEFPHIEEQSQTSTAGKWMPRAPKKEGQATAKQCKKKKLHIAVVSESPGGLSFSERADLRREVSRAERVSDEEERSTPQRLCHDKPIGPNPAVYGMHNEYDNMQWGQEKPWQRLSLAVDSGAAETVIPHTLVGQHPIRETEASRGGLNYVSATGDPIPNLGEQRLPLMTQEGTLRAMTFQAAPVDRPLGSVKRMCDAGHIVVFDEEGSYVCNKYTGEINWLREENGNYMMDMWVMPGQNSTPDFTRQC